MSTLLIGLLHSLGVKFGLSLLSSRVPGPVKLCPGKCISNGKLLTALLRRPLPALTNLIFIFPQTLQIPLCTNRPFLAVNGCTFIVYGRPME